MINTKADERTGVRELAIILFMERSYKDWADAGSYSGEIAWNTLTWFQHRTVLACGWQRSGREERKRAHLLFRSFQPHEPFDAASPGRARLLHHGFGDSQPQQGLGRSTSKHRKTDSLFGAQDLDPDWGDWNDIRMRWACWNFVSHSILAGNLQFSPRETRHSSFCIPSGPLARLFPVSGKAAMPELTRPAAASPAIPPARTSAWMVSSLPRW